MRFLIDNALSPALAEGLRQGGHNAVHVRQLGMERVNDEVIAAHAVAEDRVLITGDTDFGTLHAVWSTSKPSVILFRKGTDQEPLWQVPNLLALLHET